MNKLKVKDKRFELADSYTLDSDLVVRPNIYLLVVSSGGEQMLWEEICLQECG